jgi:hypothetical protein
MHNLTPSKFFELTCSARKRHVYRAGLALVLVCCVGCSTVYRTNSKVPKQARFTLTSQPPANQVYVNGRRVADTSPVSLDHAFAVKQQTVTPSDQRQAYAYLPICMFALFIPCIYMMVKYPDYERTVADPNACTSAKSFGQGPPETKRRFLPKAA